MSITKDIIEQIGGNKFFAMTGCKAITDEKNMKVTFHIPRNGSKANRLDIKLNGKDLYDMRFYKYRMPKTKFDLEKMEIKEIKEINKTIKEYKDVYFDMLQELFTGVTKMYTHL